MTTLTAQKKFQYAQISTILEHPEVMIVEATGTYIPTEDFKIIFNYIAESLKGKKFKKLIFDKRKLSVFNQSSMEWYFSEWKDKVYELGLTTHRKILPDNKVFIQSVAIGRENIAKKFPSGKFLKMDIQYSKSLEDAIAV